MNLMIIRMALVSLLTLGCSYTDSPKNNKKDIDLRMTMPQAAGKNTPIKPSHVLTVTLYCPCFHSYFFFQKKRPPTS